MLRFDCIALDFLVRVNVAGMQIEAMFPGKRKPFVCSQFIRGAGLAGIITGHSQTAA